MDLPPLDETDSTFQTKVLSIKDFSKIETNELSEAVELLKRGEVVAFPTETVYGLGANALDANAVSKIFKAKGRPSDNPLIVHVSSLPMLKQLVSEDAFPKEEVENGKPSIAQQLVKRFWPGALTILFKRSEMVPKNVTAGLDVVGVRMVAHPVARKLIELANIPIAAPSANRSGKPSPTLAEHVLQDLNGRIPCIVDGGLADYGVESTVVDINSNPPLILRPGGVTLEQLREIVPNIQVYEKKVHGSELEKQPPTPGLKYRHYSPTARVVVFEEQSDTSLKISQRAQSELDSNRSVAIIQTHTSNNYNKLQSKYPETCIIYPLGDQTQPELVAKGIFKALRDLDDKKIQIIFIEGISEENVGLAVMNRIRKAASEIVSSS